MKTSFKSILLLSLVVAFFLPTLQLQAQSNVIWKNVGTDWNTGANWSNGVVPGSLDAAIFNIAVTQNPSLSVSSEVARVTTTGTSIAVGSFTLSSSATNIALTLLASGTGINSAINYSDNTGGTLTISAPLILGNATNGSQTIQVANATSRVEISGVISSATTQGLIKGGDGALVLSGLNTYGGVTTIGGGVLHADNLANAGSSSSIGTNQTVTITNGGALTYGGATNSAMNRGLNLAAGQGIVGVSNPSVSLTLSGVISNVGSLVKNGAGTLILSGANSYSGGTLVSGGTVQGTTTSLQGNITNNSVLLFNQSTNGTYSGALSGNGSLTKAGAGSVTLSNVNTYTGGTIIVANSLISGANGALGSGRLTFSNPSTARLELNGFTNTVTGLTVSGAGTKVIQNEGASGSAGRLTVDLVSGTDSSDANTIIRDRSTGSLGRLALTKNGAGTLDLSVINAGTAYSGGLTVNAGTLGFGAATNAVGSGAITLGGGTLRYTATGSTNATLSNTFSLTPSTTSAIEVPASTVALSVTNVISGSGALAKTGAGTLVLSGTNTYSGSTAINAGTLTLATNGSLRFVIGGSGTNNALSGTGTTTMRGQFAFDLTGASTATNATWTIVANTLANSYGTNFVVSGFNGVSGGNWTNTTNGVSYVFAQANGVLSVQSAASPSPYNSWVSYWQILYPSFTNTGGTENPDGDPFDNNEEFAFDGNPMIGTGALLTVTPVGTNAVFNYVALTNTNAVTYQVQNTTNLSAGPWSNTVVTISNSANQSGISQTNNYLRKEFVVPATTNNFYRVQAAIAP
jgi:autotransporter-associated beta strand protein